MCNSQESQHYNFCVYQFIRENGGFYNWDVVLVENVIGCTSSWELHARERYWIDTLKSELNKHIPNRTQKEYKRKYRELNKDEISEKSKKYREQNKDKIKVSQTKFREENTDKIKKSYRKFYDLNKDKIIKQQKEYRELNRDRIREK
jgi:hypothetical protein